MKLKLQPRDSFELFQAHFDQILNPGHELIRLACKIDWPALDAAFADCYRPELGAPAKAVRLVVGLHYAKYAFDESDESVVARWIENPYWQYFCGYTHMQHECPIHPTSMTKVAESRRCRADGETFGGNDCPGRSREAPAQE